MESLDVGSFVMGLMLGVVDAVAVMLLLRSRSLEKRLKCAAPPRPRPFRTGGRTRHRPGHLRYRQNGSR